MRAQNDAGAGPQSASGVVLQVLRITLHAGFAVLLAVGVGRVLLGAPHAATSYVALALAVVLAAVYLTGTVAEKQAADGGPVLWGLDPAKYAVAWLAVITGLWLLLLVTDADFSWLAFPLFFLHIHLLGTGHAIFAVAMMTAAVVAAQWYHAGELHVAMVLGPVFGAAFAVVMAIAYQSLYAEGVNQRLALDELRRTRAELARTQHEAGVLAERERLAREIHDTLAQGLSSIVLVSRAAGSALAAGQTETAQERIGTVQSTAAENLAEARRFVRGLSSPGLEDGSLIQSLRRVCEATERQAAGRGDQLDCRFEFDGNPVPLPAPFEVALLRAAQSSLSNVALHAQAGTAVVTLGFVGPEVTLDVFDDGIGFDAPAALAATQPREDGSGYGLLSVRERVATLGGTLSIDSAPGEGTVLAVKLPLPEVEALSDIRILLVDDHPVVRAGLRAMLTDFEGISVAAEAADGAEALEFLRRSKTLGEPVGVVLMDLQMGAGMDGVTATREIRAIEGSPPVLILTTYDTDADILAAVEAGASGYMLKDAPPEQIRQAVQSAAAGQTALAPEVAARLMGRIQNPQPSLSAREIQLLELLATGMSNRAMAKELFISEATVKTHLVHIYGKLGVDNRTAAISVARQRRIIRN